MQIHNIPPWVTVTFFGGTLALALWRGDGALRLLGVLFCLPATIYQGGSYLGGSGEPMDQRILLVLDVLMFLACMWLVVTRRNWWVIWAAAAQLLTMITYPLFWRNSAVGFWAFASAQLVWAYVAVAAVLFGALARRRPTGPASR